MIASYFTEINKTSLVIFVVQDIPSVVEIRKAAKEAAAAASIRLLGMNEKEFLQKANTSQTGYIDLTLGCRRLLTFSFFRKSSTILSKEPRYSNTSGC